jgi:hypothetical protein
MKNPQIKIVHEDDKYVYVVLYFDKGGWDWYELKLKIPKDRLKEI